MSIWEGIAPDTNFRAKDPGTNPNNFVMNNRDDLARYDERSGAYWDQYQDGLQNAAASRRDQTKSLDQLYGLATGAGPSLAQQQLRQGLQQAQAQSLGTASGARGGGAGLASTRALALQQQAQLAAQANEASGLVRAQEQIGASNAYAQAVAQQRQQDVALSALAGQMGMSIEELKARMQQAALDAKLKAEQLRVQGSLGADQINAGIALGNLDSANKAMSGVFGLMGGLLGAAGAGGAK